MNTSAVSEPLLKHLDKVINSPVSAILYLEGNRNYTMFWLSNGTHVLVSKSLCFYENVLPSHFLRIHRSFIVNLNYALTWCKETRHIHLQNGINIPVARRREKVLSQYRHN